MRAWPGSHSIASQAQPSIVSMAKPEIAQLAASANESVVLHGVAEDQAIVLDQALHLTHVVVVRHDPGSRHPLYRGDSGWPLLVYQPQRRVSRILSALPDTEQATALQRINKGRALGWRIRATNCRWASMALPHRSVGRMELRAASASR